MSGENKNRENKLIKNTFILSIGTFMPKFAGYITLPILTGYLTKEQYGTYDLVTLLVSLLLPVATLQIHTAAFRFLIEHKHDREKAKLYYSNILAFVIPMSLAVLLITYLLLPIPSPALKVWICIYFFFDTMVAEARQITRGLSRNMDYSISSIVSAFIKMTFVVILVNVFHFEILGAVIALALSQIFSLTYLVIKVELYELVDFRLFDPAVLKEMLAYSWPMVPNNMSMWVMRVSDRFVVTMFMGVAWNAVYAVANKIPSLLSLAQSTFTLAWQENASIVSKDKDAAEYYSSMFSVMLNLYAGFLGLLLACTPVLFKLLIRGDYGDAYEQIPILFLAMFFSCMSTFVGGIYIAFKETKNVGISTVLAALCNLVVDLALIKFIGLYAASGSTLVSYTFLFIYRTVNIRKFVAIRYNAKQLILTIGLLIVESAIYYINTLYSNILNFAIGAIAFVILNKALIRGFFVKGGALIRKLKKRF